MPDAMNHCVKTLVHQCWQPTSSALESDHPRPRRPKCVDHMHSHVERMAYTKYCTIQELQLCLRHTVQVVPIDTACLRENHDCHSQPGITTREYILSMKEG